ncbi:TetR/AcrR family transcriptional regulator [Rhodococcus sp. X156]|uniref:TetR/AcrR family transcriptional regulator n=1 Tax=Rhodococcus sp. X156 TaxID=2499145 RepID=UPI000FDA90EA|nr:TetR/AcrR family transcriptional regulator [Rhodococcus sp. X156]
MSVVRTEKAAQVLRAAAELFYAHGIHAVGVDTIAAAAGVSKKTLYERFGSKDRLVAEYLAERDAQWHSFLQERLRETDPAPVEQVVAVFRAAAEWAAQRGGKGCAMVNAHAEISDPAHPAHAAIVGQKRWMLELFRELAVQAGAAEPDEVAETLMLLHEGAVVSAGMSTFAGAFDRAATAARRLMVSPARRR